MDSIAFQLKDLRKLKGSLVYVVSRQDAGKSKVIYVGRSNVGIDRPLETYHKAISKCKATDVVRLIFCKSAYEAAKLEVKLIHEHHPELNIRKPEHKLIIMKKVNSCP